MKRHLLWALFTLCCAFPAPARAQMASLTGAVVDSATGSPVVGARVRLATEADTSRAVLTTSNDQGAFSFGAVAPGRYLLQLTRLGYAALSRHLTLAPGASNLGRLPLRSTVLSMSGVVVKASPPVAIQNGDTTEFSAGAVKTNPDANVEDLVTKMPGVTVDNSGAVKSNGETVQQVLVDGKPFFGSDPTIALRNLPADVVDKIQVYDKMSDQSEFSGFDDGQTTKTMNIILRADKRHATFGKGYAGGGQGYTADDQDSHYQTGGNLNVLRGPSRFSAIGLANDVNQQNFSAQDLLGVLNPAGGRGGGFGGGGGGGFGGGGGGAGGGGRRFGGGGGGGGRGDPGALANGAFGNAGTFLVGPQEGVTSPKSLGLHGLAATSTKFSFNGSYFFNDTDNHNEQDLTRQYVVPLDSVTHYDQTSVSSSTNKNHRLDGRIEWQPDSTNSLLDQPRLYFQSHDATGSTGSENLFFNGDPANRAASATNNETSGNDLSNHLLLRHRFAKRGRTVSLDLGAAHTLKDGTGLQHSLVDYDATDPTLSDTLDQRSDLHTTTNTFSARMVYTEPLGKKSAVQATLSPGVSNSASNAIGHQLDPATGLYTIPDTALTNQFTTSNSSQNAGLGYLASRGGLRWNASLAWQRSTLESERTFPVAGQLDRTFYDLLPSLQMNANLSNRRNLRLSITTSTRTPSVSQLQDVVDNSNPLILSTGNPLLLQPYVISANARFSRTEPGKSHSLFLVLLVQHTSHPIANSTFTAATDTVIHGIALAPGTQLVFPVNLDRAWNANTFATLSRPLKAIKSVLNLTTGLSYSLLPGLVSDAYNEANTYAVSQGVVLASNISPAVDFTVSYNGTYNLVRNTSSMVADDDYYSHEASLKLNVQTWKSIVLREELSQSLLTGVASGFGQNAVLWNSSLGKKLMDDRVDLRLTAVDILDRNQSASRTVTDSYVQDATNLVLSPYVMLTATYTWK
jgi:uncharacterized membrane protein YgcG